MVSDAVPDPDPERGFWIHALLGGVVAVVLSFVPFSPALGGAVAGYLQGEDGVRVGAASGLVAAVPTLALFALFAVFLGFVGPGAAEFLVLLAVALVFWFGISAALGAVGGVVGVALADEYGPTTRNADPA
jgi:hypothetical protein